MRKYFKSIICVLIIATMAIALTGCSEIQKAEKTVENMFEAFKALDFEKARKYVDLNDLTEEDENGLVGNRKLFMEKLFDKLDYKILSSEQVEDDKVIVKAEITAVNMEPVLAKFFISAMEFSIKSATDGTALSDEEKNKKLEELFVESVSDPDLDKVTNEVAIEVEKEDGKWRVDSNEEFIDALLGGFQTAADKLKETLAKRMGSLAK